MNSRSGPGNGRCPPSCSIGKKWSGSSGPASEIGLRLPWGDYKRKRVQFIGGGGAFFQWPLASFARARAASVAWVGPPRLGHPRVQPEGRPVRGGVPPLRQQLAAWARIVTGAGAARTASPSRAATASRAPSTRPSSCGAAGKATPATVARTLCGRWSEDATGWSRGSGSRNALTRGPCRQWQYGPGCPVFQPRMVAAVHLSNGGRTIAK